MSLPVIIAVNQTASPVFFDRLGLTVPANDSLELTAYAWRHEIVADESLYSATVADQILLRLGETPQTKGASLKFFGLVAQEVRAPVRMVGASQTTLSGVGGTVDGVTVALGDRILLLDQTDPLENGVWVAQSGSWVRPDDFAAGTSVLGALFLTGPEGDTYANQLWQVSGASAQDVVGTDPIRFKKADDPLRDWTVSRDIEGVVLSASSGSETWTVNRNLDGTVSDITNGLITKTLVRDINGAVIGVVVS